MSNFDNQHFDQQRNQVPSFIGSDEGNFPQGGNNYDQRSNEFQNSPQWNQPGSQNREQPGPQFQDQNRNVDERGQKIGGTNAFNAERPLNVQPTPEGGVARDGKSGLPEGRAGFTDKLIGKTEKVTGNFTNNPELHEKGEFRESGGRAAQRGEARAPHD